MTSNDILRWSRNSFSGGDPNACVEVGFRWRKSSFSGGGNNECVEVASRLVALRDSKNPDGPVLRVDLHDLLAAVKAARLVS